MTPEQIAAGFPDWVAKQNPAEWYDYSDVAGCAFAQYLHSLGYHAAIVGGHTYWPGLNKDGSEIVGAQRIPPAITQALDDCYLNTFGALDELLKAALLEDGLEGA